MMRKAATSFALLVGVFWSHASAYGPKGHALVGAIADQRLAGSSVSTRIGDLLDGMTLAEAALLPDKIKDWDKKDPTTHPDAFHLPDHKEIEKELIDFWMANPPTARNPDQLPPNHHWFHYTDVPVAVGATYAKGKIGRSQWDVVHMIPYCAAVLQGKVSEDNPRKITKRIAVMLLAHYVGDIHQPLHVGAQYFDAHGKPINPDDDGPGFADEGGNTLNLRLQEADDHGHTHATYILHSYWDDQTVDTALELLRQGVRANRPGSSGQITDSDIARRLASQEPANWKLESAGGIDKLTIAWADEILPFALEAHQRLDFPNIHIDSHKMAAGLAVERPNRQGESYHDWAGKLVRNELHKAGWRLADLLKTVLEQP